MANVAVVYWSQSGNTEAMANAVVEGIKEQGASADLFQASEFSSDLMDNYDGVAFGCPAMGAENLEESEFEPMFNDCESKLGGKTVVLFGSYGWGDGEWMRNWQDQVVSDGANLITDGLIINETPDDSGLEECKELGKALAQAL